MVDLNQIHPETNKRQVMTNSITLYARVSTRKTESDTTENQFNEIRRWAVDNGFVVNGEFKDLCSGRELKCRLGLREAIIHSKAVGSKIAVVESSRLSRSVKDTADLMASTTEFIFTRSGRSMSKEMILVGSIFNQMESESISRRVTAGINNLFETTPGAREAWGSARYRKENIEALHQGNITSADEFALEFGDYAVMLQEGGMTLRKIADAYNGKEIPTRREGNKWSHSTIRSLIIRYKNLND